MTLLQKKFLAVFFVFILALLSLKLKPAPLYAQPLDPSLTGYEKVKPPTRPSIKIVSPQQQTSLIGGKVVLEYILKGIKLVGPEKNPLAVRGEGHLNIVFARKGYTVPKPQVFTEKSPLQFENIPEGEYRITIEVMKNNGKSYLPPVQDTTKFKVVHSVPPSPRPTFTPTPTPVPLQKRFPFTRQEVLLVLGIMFFVAPAVYLFLVKSKAGS